MGRNLRTLGVTARDSPSSLSLTFLEFPFFFPPHLLASAEPLLAGTEWERLPYLWTHSSSHCMCHWKSPRPRQKNLEFQSMAQPTSSLILREQAFSWFRRKVRTHEDAEQIYERYSPEWCCWVGEVCDRWSRLDLLILWYWAAVPESAISACSNGRWCMITCSRSVCYKGIGEMLTEQTAPPQFQMVNSFSVFCKV